MVFCVVFCVFFLLCVLRAMLWNGGFCDGFAVSGKHVACFVFVCVLRDGAYLGGSNVIYSRGIFVHE